MHVNKLPDVVLARIFHWAYNNPIHLFAMNSKQETWKAKFTLLAVCRLWRELALPFAHRVSFVQCIDARKPNESGNSVAYHTPDLAEPENLGKLDYIGREECAVQSNLDIIGNTGNRCWPRTIQLSIQSSNDQMYSLQQIIEKIRKHTALLKNVVMLELDYRRLATIPSVDEATDVADASSIGEEFSQLMPHVQQIKLGSYTNLGIIEDFARSVVKSYAHQLTGFRGHQSILRKTQCLSDNLRYFFVQVGRETPYMPQICAENLTSLTLDNVNSSFDRRAFKSNGSSSSLHFANLKLLRLRAEIDFNGDGVGTSQIRYLAREFNYKVIAPKLETVILQLCPFTLSLLASIHGLATIHNVELELETAHVYFTEFDLDMARDKFASYAKNSQDNFQAIDTYSYMNDMFNIRGLAKSSKACVKYSELLNFEQMDWKYLLNIEIHRPFHVNGLRTLVSKAPSLETIHINAIRVKKNGGLIPEIQDEAATVELISPNLKSISFGCVVGCTESEKDKFMVYLSKLTLND